LNPLTTFDYPKGSGKKTEKSSGDSEPKTTIVVEVTFQASGEKSHSEKT